ncbi:tRNA (N(6)-L-threonylcarbamoyladenosine(37)-C(2))-methylthiotransferase MtaB [Bacteroidia bacterium]|nr:tRNA (N(6)-L-threonylcarbamoyladenosine(37)-C(2))-methylthiotransferase MtaB [Bacteroidia bacterium]
MNGKNIAIHTLGCKLNFSESSSLLKVFIDAGYNVVDVKDIADVYIINTCAVTATAEKKCRAIIRQVIKENSKAIVAVVGCMSQISANEIKKIEGVDIVLGNDDKHLLLNFVEKLMTNVDVDVNQSKKQWQFIPAISHNDRTRVFLKVQDGCDYFCSYCAIPFARGRNRCDSIENTVNSVKNILKENAVKEIVLTGINIGEFGKNGETFFDLIKAFDKIEDIARYRISSIEPNLLTDEIVEWISRSRAFLPHFHIPLQSGCDKILKLMKRRYNTELFAQKIALIKQFMPDAFIACDIIAGFPEETDEDFESAYNFVQSLSISYLHVFPYSERPGTISATLTNKVASDVKKQRTQRLQNLSHQKEKSFIESQKGKIFNVLWESANDNGFMSGFTENYIRVKKAYDLASINTIEPLIL